MGPGLGMTGIVLAGGRSRRFGENKAFARIGRKRLIDHVVDSHRAIFDEVIVVTARPLDHAELGCAVVADLLPHKGPLCGIATGLLAAAHERVFVTACDMPFLQRELLVHLIEQSRGKQVVVPVIGGRREPLHAVYARACLPHMMEDLARGGVPRVIDLYPRVNVREVGEEELRRFDPDLVSFFNVNTREDLERAEALLISHSPGPPP